MTKPKRRSTAPKTTDVLSPVKQLGGDFDRIMELCVGIVAIIYANTHVAASVFGARSKRSLYVDFVSHFDLTLRTQVIELAVNFRIFDESAYHNPAYIELKSELESQKLGVFHESELLPANNKGALSLRDCANKLIHAEQFRFELGAITTEDISTGRKYTNKIETEKVVVFGHHRSGEAWVCRIDLLEFAEICHELISQWSNIEHNKPN